MTAAVVPLIASVLAELDDQGQTQADEFAELRQQIAELRAAVAGATLTPAALDTFASFVDARIAPRLAVLEDRAGRIEAELRGAGSTLHVLSRQIGRMRRSRR